MTVIRSLDDFYSRLRTTPEGHVFCPSRRGLPSTTFFNTSLGEHAYHRILFRLRYPDIEIKHYSLTPLCDQEGCLAAEHRQRGLWTPPEMRRWARDKS